MRVHHLRFFANKLLITTTCLKSVTTTIGLLFSWLQMLHCTVVINNCPRTEATYYVDILVVTLLHNTVGSYPKRATRSELPEASYPKRATRSELPEASYPKRATRSELPEASYPKQYNTSRVVLCRRCLRKGKL